MARTSLPTLLGAGVALHSRTHSQHTSTHRHPGYLRLSPLSRHLSAGIGECGGVSEMRWHHTTRGYRGPSALYPDSRPPPPPPRVMVWARGLCVCVWGGGRFEGRQTDYVYIQTMYIYQWCGVENVFSRHYSGRHHTSHPPPISPYLPLSPLSMTGEGHPPTPHPRLTRP